MIKLNYSPFEGSTVKVTLSFRDSFGKYYVPLSLNYTLLALNSDKESWSVVGDEYKVNVQPASQVPLTISNTSLISGTTLQRKVLIQWVALVDGQVTDFIDEVVFEIQPMPYITNKPVEPEPTPIYLEVKDVEFQTGNPIACPIDPVLKLYTNLPVDIEDAEIIFTSDKDSINSTISLDSTSSVITVVPDVSLEYGTSYTLVARGLVSKVQGYEMETDFRYNLVTISAGEITFEQLVQKVSELDERVTALEG